MVRCLAHLFVEAEAEHESVGLAILSAIITFLFIKPLTADGMEKEDREVSAFFIDKLRFIMASAHWQISFASILRRTGMTQARWDSLTR